MLIAGIPFNATLYFFGTSEPLGHLPIYAVMLVLLVYGSQPQLRPLVKSLRLPPRPEGRIGRRDRGREFPPPIGGRPAPEPGR